MFRIVPVPFRWFSPVVLQPELMMHQVDLESAEPPFLANIASSSSSSSLSTQVVGVHRPLRLDNKQWVAILVWILITLFCILLWIFWAIPGIESQRRVDCEMIQCDPDGYCNRSTRCHNAKVHLFTDPDSKIYVVKFHGRICPTELPTDTIDCYFDARDPVDTMSLERSRMALYLLVGLLPLLCWLFLTGCIGMVEMDRRKRNQGHR